VTDAERRRWRRWCWFLLISGPITTWAALPLCPVLSKLLPNAALQFVVEPLVVAGLPLAASLGAAFCRARSHTTPLTDADRVGFLIVMTVVFVFPMAAATCLGFAVFSLFQ